MVFIMFSLCFLALTFISFLTYFTTLPLIINSFPTASFHFFHGKGAVAMRTFSTLNHGPNNAMSFLCMFLAVCCEPFCKCDTLLTSTLLTNIVATAAFFFVAWAMVVSAAFWQRQGRFCWIDYVTSCFWFHRSICFNGYFIITHQIF